MNARTVDRTLIYGSAILLALWVIVPFYLIFLSAFSRPNDVFVYPKPLIPTSFSTETMEFFLQSTGVFASVLNSIAVAAITIVLSLALGAPAGVSAGVSNELEEAAMTLGCSRFTAFLRVALPLALPGLAAAAIFTFVISWNEVFAASILTLRQRTLPALVLFALQQSPLYFKFAGGFFMVMPAVVFIFFMRRYLLNLWGGR